MRLLAGDIGGTKTELALVRLRGKTLQTLRTQRFSSRDYEGLESVLEAFGREDLAGLQGACFGVAGPVEDNRCHTTNLPWFLEGKKLARKLRLPRVTLCNDFVAVAQAVASPYLEPEHLVQLKPGDAVRGAPVAVLGAGTGLGHAFLVPTEQGSVVLASEAGHRAYAPRSTEQIRFVEWFARRGVWPTVEDVCSGRGMANLYRFAREVEGLEPTREVREALEQGADFGAVLGPAGMARRDPVATRVLRLFVQAYAHAAADMALTAVARGGVVLAGGVTQALRAELAVDDVFAREFAAHPVYGSLLASIPVHLLAHPNPGLLGAMTLAARDAQAGKRTARSRSPKAP